MDKLTLKQVRDEKVVEVVIDDYGFTGEGFVRLEDGWLSVFGGLPGERVRVEVEAGQREQARRLFCRVLAVLETSPSSGRQDPLCARASVCRGCQLRHFTVAEELRFKARIVREVIEKFAGISPQDQPPIEVITPQPVARGDAFRIRTALTYRRKGDGFELGLISRGRDHLISMADCPALTGPVQRTVSVVMSALNALSVLPWDGAMARSVAEQVQGFATAPGLVLVRIAAPNHGHGFIELQITECDSDQAFDTALENAPLKALTNELQARLPERVGVAATDGSHLRIIKTPERIRLPVASLELEVGHQDWFHANPLPAEAMYDALQQLLELNGSERLLDVGCGIGTIALLCAPHVESVVGMDINRHSIETAQINAAGTGVDNVEFVAGGWETGLRRLTSRQARFSVATINPMREPVGRRALAYLERLGIKRVVYLGPSPAAAAKDIGELGELGWRLDYLAAANLHPATYHTMLVARLILEN